MPPDPKPEKRLRNQANLEKFRLAHSNEPCSHCELRPGVHVHHRFFRSQGGDDIPENLQWLCHVCHDAAHGIRSFL